MTNEQFTYQMPNAGCMLGTAYQILASQLAGKLTEAGLALTVPEYMILRALYTQDGMQQCEIGSMLGKDKGAISRCVTTMVRKKLVTTESVSHKCLRVFLSPEGHRIRDIILTIADERHRALESLLTPDEMNCFATVLKKIISTKI